jgi:glycosyltransferase involved in cell wall biosynthesis
MDKVRVLFLPSIDTYNVNAQSLNVREIARRLDPRRFQTTLWYEREPDGRLLRIPEICLKQLPQQRRTLRILREMLSGYDLIGYMDYSPASSLFLRLPKILRGSAKTILHVEGIVELDNPSRTLRFLHESIFPRCDVHTGITEFVATDVNKKFGLRVSHILPVGVDTTFFVPPAARRNSMPVVLFAGAIIERKGLHIVLDAAARFPNAMFRIIGAARGGFDGVLQQRILQLGLRNVTLEGPKSQAELLEIMWNSDIFLLPSHLEGIPKVSLEAAATGLPCVVFRDYQTPSVIDGVTGFQSGSNEEMMQAVGRLISDSDLREQMGKKARDHVKQFDWDVVARLWQNAYLEIAASRLS